MYPEARAAVAAARRGGRIDDRTLRQAVDELDALYGELSVIGVDDALARDAGALAERHRLRGYDAVHLASALSVSDAGLVVATWDRDLADAALACGRTVAGR